MRQAQFDAARPRTYLLVRLEALVSERTCDVFADYKGRGCGTCGRDETAHRLKALLAQLTAQGLL